MSYVKSNLIADENILYTAKKSWLASWFLILLGLATATIGVGVLILIYVIASTLTTELVITNKRVIAKFGLIARSTVELKIERIESVQVVQGIFGRIFNFGSLIISGGGAPQAPISGINDPLAFRAKLALLTDKF